MKRIIIIGAGEAGRLLKEDINKNTASYNIIFCGFVDDKVKEDLILGKIDNLQKILIKDQIDEIIIAIPSERGKIIRKILLQKAEHPNVKVKILPRTSDVIIGSKVSYKSTRDIHLTDIVGEGLDKIAHEKIAGNFKDKQILVTGGGGSIGSEIVRQIFLSAPKKLLVIDSCELNLFNIANSIEKLKDLSPNTEIDFILGNVLNTALLNHLFSENKIDIVFHAAAYKHVPLVEANAYEGLSNNFLATYRIVELCHEYNIPKFVLISTDKAVNPVNVMGKSKRLAELAVKHFDELTSDKSIFTAVRFGNVFNSSGSAVQLFQKQLEDGNTLTITDRRMTRYFMTIPEAVHLVLQASVMAKKGSIYMLEMGDPVSIEELAKCISILKGKKTSEVKFTYCGLRPGEKLEEELFDRTKEVNNPTSNKKIFSIQKNENSNHFLKLSNSLIDLLSKEHIRSHSKKGVLELNEILQTLI